jgi:hypothetical protein
MFVSWVELSWCGWLSVMCLRLCAREQTGRTALLLSCANGHLSVVQWLVTSAISEFRSERDNVGR